MGPRDHRAHAAHSLPDPCAHAQAAALDELDSRVHSGDQEAARSTARTRGACSGRRCCSTSKTIRTVLPAVAQLPVFLSVYFMLRIELRHDICPGINSPGPS